MDLSKKGMACSILTSVLFACMPAYFLWLQPLTSTQILALRIIWTFIAMFLLLILSKQIYSFQITLKRILNKPILFAGITLCAFISGLHQGIFVWGPVSGTMLEISLGYFLAPLVMVICGRFFYKETMRPLQILAVCLAAMGVIYQIWVIHTISWITLVITTTYPLYFMIRRKMEIQPITGYILEMLVLLPISITVIIYLNPFSEFKEAPLLWLLVPGLGLLTAVAFATLLAASRLLPFSLFGILSYLEPALLFAFAVLILKEPLSSSDLWTYIPIWIAILFVILDSLRIMQKQIRSAYKINNLT